MHVCGKKIRFRSSVYRRVIVISRRGRGHCKGKLFLDQDTVFRNSFPTRMDGLRSQCPSRVSHPIGWPNGGQHHSAEPYCCCGAVWVLTTVRSLSRSLLVPHLFLVATRPSSVSLALSVRVSFLRRRNIRMWPRERWCRNLPCLDLDLSGYDVLFFESSHSRYVFSGTFNGTHTRTHTHIELCFAYQRGRER